nr:MAG TPA: hypothetical protein [Caudoviricetes sp.]
MARTCITCQQSLYSHLYKQGGVSELLLRRRSLLYSSSQIFM